MSEHALITADLVRLDVADAADKDAVVDTLLDVVGEAGRAEDREAVRRDLLARETVGATAIPGGIAIPHARTEGVSVRTVGLLRLTAPVDWSPGRPPVDLVLGLFCPADDNQGYLSLLASVTRAVVGRLPAELRGAGSAEEAAAVVARVTG